MNYVEIASKIIDTVENNDDEFIARVQEFINTAEEGLLKRIDSDWLDGSVDVTLTTGSYEIDAPDLKVPRAVVVYTASGRAFNLVPRNKSWLREYWPVVTSVGEPKYYAKVGTVINFAPAAGEDYLIHVEGVFKPEALSSANVDNAFTLNASYALFFGAMVEANKYLKNWKTVDVWTKEYEKEVNLIINEARRNRRDDTRPQQSASGPNNIMPQVP